MASSDNLTTKTPAFLSASNLRKSFGGLAAVDGLSFDIHKQEIFGAPGTQRGRQDHHHPHAVDGAFPG